MLAELIVKAIEGEAVIIEEVIDPADNYLP